MGTLKSENRKPGGDCLWPQETRMLLQTPAFGLSE
jgi:hypothetical protein